MKTINLINTKMILTVKPEGHICKFLFTTVGWGTCPNEFEPRPYFKKRARGIT